MACLTTSAMTKKYQISIIILVIGLVALYLLNQLDLDLIHIIPSSNTATFFQPKKCNPATNNAAWIPSNTSELKHKIENFNEVLEEIYDHILQEPVKSFQRKENSEGVKVTVLDGLSTSFLSQVQEDMNVITLLLPWSNIPCVNKNETLQNKNISFYGNINICQDVSTIKYNSSCKIYKYGHNEYLGNTDMSIATLPVKRYYRCVLGYTLLYETQLGKSDNPKSVFNRSCMADLDTMTLPQAFNPAYFIYHYSNESREDEAFSGVAQSFLSKSSDIYSIPEQWNPDCAVCDSAPRFITYINIIHNNKPVVIDRHGFVYFENKAIMSHMCPFYQPTTIPRRAFRTSKTVLVLTQSNINNYYHEFVEMVLKVVFYAPFLRSNPNVLLHVSHGRDWIRVLFNMLAMNNSVITGNVQSPVVLLPMGNGCHDPPAPLLQYTQQLFKHMSVKNKPNTSQKLVVFVTRSKNRMILNQEEIVNTVQHLNSQHGNSLQIHIFNDSNLPSFQDTVLLFQRASILIAPHGAGLSNIVFCKPGTVLIEVTCYLGFARPCYRNMAYKLGLRYYATQTTERNRGYRCSNGLQADMKDINKTLNFVFTQPWNK